MRRTMLTRMMKSDSLGKEHGATAPEYALLIALIENPSTLIKA